MIKDNTVIIGDRVDQNYDLCHKKLITIELLHINSVFITLFILLFITIKNLCMTHKLFTDVKDHILQDHDDPARDPSLASVE